MIYIAWFVLIFAASRFLVACVNLLSPLYLKKTTEVHREKLSVLIPARNEAHNLPRLIQEIDAQHYENMEIVVYNDQSDDDSEIVLKALQLKYARLKVLHAENLPEGWTGKNHACYQLAQYATGDYFLFLDADVQVKGALFQNAVSFMKKNALKLLSVFPQQDIKTLGEKFTVPLMNWILLSLLPLILVQKSKRKSLAAANGQFMLFDAATYRQNQWHHKLKSSLVEDIEIIRLMKSRKFNVATLLGNNDVVCRMYNNYSEGVHGFSKNVIQFFGNSSFAAVGFLIVVLSGFLFILLSLSVKHLLIYLVLVIGIRIFIALKSKQSLMWNLLLHPLQMLVFMTIVMRGMIVKRKRQYQWKGRNIKQ